MDTTDYPSLGRLTGLSLQLGIQARQVEAVVVAQLDEVERLFRAVADCDWDAVMRLSAALASTPKEQADQAVVRSAKKVCDSLRRDPSGSKVGRPVGELLSACRTAKLRRMAHEHDCDKKAASQ